jgi:hypothetical protein
MVLLRVFRQSERLCRAEANDPKRNDRIQAPKTR